MKRGCHCNKKKPLGNKAQGAAKTIVKNDPETLQNSARHVPRPSKIEAREVPGSQNPPKRCPRPAKRGPRAPKKTPRAGQGPPKRSQEPSKSTKKPAKRRQRVPQTPPKPGPTSPKTSFEHVFCGKLCSASSGSDFLSFFVLCATRAMCKNHTKTYVFPRFLRIQSLCEKQARVHPKSSKNKLRRLKKLTRRAPRPLKITPEAFQDARKTPTSAKKRSKKRRKRPRSAQDRKIAPKSEK